MSTEEKDPNDLPLTWAGLKEFANALTEEQLKQKVMLMDGDIPIDVDTVSEAGQVTYYFPELDHSITEEGFDPTDFDGKYKTLTEALAGEDHARCEADRVFLYANI